MCENWVDARAPWRHQLLHVLANLCCSVWFFCVCVCRVFMVSFTWKEYEARTSNVLFLHFKLPFRMLLTFCHEVFFAFSWPFFVCVRCDVMLVVLLLFLLCQEENDSVLLVASLLSERYLCSLWRRFAEEERERESEWESSHLPGR